MRFSAPFDTQEDGIVMYTGTVVEIANSADAYPNSAWDSLKVRWDDVSEDSGEGNNVL